MKFSELAEAALPLAEAILDKADHKNLADITIALRALFLGIRMARMGKVTPQEALENGQKIVRSLQANDAAADHAVQAKFGDKK